MLQQRNQVPSVKNSHNMVDVVSEDWNPGVVFFCQDVKHLSRWGGDVEGDDVSSRYHHISAAFVGELENGADQLRRALVYQAIGGLRRKQLLQLLQRRRRRLKSHPSAKR